MPAKKQNDRTLTDRRKLWRLAAVLHLLMAAAGPALAQNLVLNPGFEAGWSGNRPESWTLWEAVTPETMLRVGGSYSARQTAPASGSQRLSQDVGGVRAGEEYEISYSFFDNTTNARHRIYSYWLANGSTRSEDAASLRPSTYVSSNSNGWRRWSVKLSAPAGVNGLRFEVRSYADQGNGGSVYFDDFSVRPTSGILLPAPVLLAASQTNASHFTVCWTPVTEVDGYQLDVSTSATFAVQLGIEEDFDDLELTRAPAWQGDAGAFAALSDATLPAGLAGTDACFAGTRPGQSCVCLTTRCLETNEWRFSLGSGDFDPSDNNYFGVVLMSDRPLCGDVVTNNFHGYYLRLGVSSGADRLRLYKSTGSGKTLVGEFNTGDYGSGGLKAGLNLRVTRSAAGQFRVFYATGFTYAADPAGDGGTLTDNTYASGVYFGLFARFNNPSDSRRVYLDNVDTASPAALGCYMGGYSNLAVTAVSQVVTGLECDVTYYCRVRALNRYATSPNSVTGTVVTRQTAEPALHVTGLAGNLVTHSTLGLCWTEAPSPNLPDGYLVKASTLGPDAIAVPVDGTPQPDGPLVRNVGYGSGSVRFWGLAPQQTYSFRVFPYANSGARIDYKTGGAVPTVQASTLRSGLAPFEDMESGIKVAYEEATETLASGEWLFSEALIGVHAADHKRDRKCARLRTAPDGTHGHLDMRFDKTNGACRVQLFHANFGTDTGGAFQLYQSTNSGVAWQPVGGPVTCGATLAQAEFNVTACGPIRFRIAKTAGAAGTRIDIDDVRLVDPALVCGYSSTGMDVSIRCAGDAALAYRVVSFTPGQAGADSVRFETNNVRSFTFTDRNALDGAERRFYRLEEIDGATVRTNAAVYATFRQTTRAGGWYKRSLPLDCGDNRLNATAGAILASGLASGGPDSADLLYLLGNDGAWKTFYLSAENSGTWKNQADSSAATDPVDPSAGFWIKRRSAGGDSVACYSGPMPARATGVTIRAGDWHLLGWPFPAPRREDQGWGFSGAHRGATWKESDLLILDNGATSEFLFIREDGRWYRFGESAPAADATLEPGKGYYYYHRGAGYVWRPETP